MNHDKLEQPAWYNAGIANGPTSRVVQRGKLRWGLAGQRKTLHRKKLHFCIILTILNTISKKNWNKPWFSHFRKFFPNFPRGVGGGTPPPTAIPGLMQKSTLGRLNVAMSYNIFNNLNY